ncbi:hypothetical protein F4775DRAFT_553047 [Biscogniauxia sp. FL1348]|nr:hypothetical protein F4775DRAFT_553047 [Biscogniauxia sp. FL1348]
MPSSSRRRGPKKQGRLVRTTTLNPEAPEFTTQGIMFSSPLTQPQSGQDSVVASPSPGATMASSPEPVADYSIQNYDCFRQTECIENMEDDHYHCQNSSPANLLEPPQQEEEQGQQDPPPSQSAAPLLESTPAQAQEHENEKKKGEEKRKIHDPKAVLKTYHEIEEDARGFSDDDEFYPGPHRE